MDPIVERVDTIAGDFDRDAGFTGGVTVANVGNQKAAEFDQTGLAADFPRQTFAKCPFFWHFMQMASLAVHLDRESLLFPQEKQDAPSVGKVAKELGS